MKKSIELGVPWLFLHAGISFYVMFIVTCQYEGRTLEIFVVIPKEGLMGIDNNNDFKVYFPMARLICNVFLPFPRRISGKSPIITQTLKDIIWQQT